MIRLHTRFSNMDTQQLEKDVEWLETADELFKIKMKAKRLREKDSILSKKLQSLSDGQTAKRGRYEYSCNPRKGAVDYKSVPQLQNVDLEPYRKASIKTWKLQVVE